MKHDFFLFTFIYFCYWGRGGEKVVPRDNIHKGTEENSLNILSFGSILQDTTYTLALM